MRCLKKLAAGTAGSQIAEAAVILPLLMMILLGVYWFGRAYNIYATINYAAIEGARVASAATCATCGNVPPTPDEIGNRVGQALRASKLDPALVTNSNLPRNSCTPGVPSPCVQPAGAPNICVYYNLQLYNAAVGEPQTCGVGVSFLYPYQFYFPFTNLQTQAIHMTADVQMKGEH
jgi:hypothetical protein